MFYKQNIDRVYIINGLARSGNHLFISWLISSFEKNTVYYLNNIKPTFYNLINDKNIDIKSIKKYHLVTEDNKYGKKLEDKVRENLVKTKDMLNFLNGKKNKIKILVISMENKKVNKIDIVSKLFTNCNNIYKCIVIRDILNLFSSRIKSEEKLVRDDNFYETDKITIDYWLDNYDNINKKEYILFNYNKFLCYSVSRKALAKKLDINYNKSKITLNKFGLTSGSSFLDNVTNKSDYFTRWVKCENNVLIKYLLKNKKIHSILCKDFSMCLNKNKTRIKICKKIYILE